MIWFTSDLHMGHYNVLKFCFRPFPDVDTMNKALTQRWNSVVGKDDTVIVVGDMFWKHGVKRATHMLGLLHGKKILVIGNHDGKACQQNMRRYKRIGFDKVYAHSFYMNIGEERVLICHYPYNPRLSRWKRFKYRAKHFWKFWRRDKYPLFKHMEKRPINKGGWLVHGHVHNAWRVKDKMINVSTDVWHYTPISIDTIESIIKLVK